jgi:hypothetical protein
MPDNIIFSDKLVMKNGNISLTYPWQAPNTASELLAVCDVRMKVFSVTHSVGQIFDNEKQTILASVPSMQGKVSVSFVFVCATQRHVLCLECFMWERNLVFCGVHN